MPDLDRATHADYARIVTHLILLGGNATACGISLHSRYSTRAITYERDKVNCRRCLDAMRQFDDR